MPVPTARRAALAASAHDASVHASVEIASRYIASRGSDWPGVSSTPIATPAALAPARYQVRETIAPASATTTAKTMGTGRTTERANGRGAKQYGVASAATHSAT